MEPPPPPPFHPGTPSLISFETGTTPTNTPHPSSLPQFQSQQSQSHIISRPRALSLLDEPEDEGPELPPPPVEVVEPAFVARRRGSSAASASREGFYEGMKGVNPDLTPTASTMATMEEQPIEQEQRTERESTLQSSVGDNSELYIPGLTSPTLFSLMPITDSLTPLLEKYLPADQRPKRDMTGEWRGSSLEDLIAARKWRSVARFCHDTILQIAPEHTSLLLSHWSLRLHALLRLSLFDCVSSELSSLFSILPPSSYLSPIPQEGEEYIFHPVIPFEFHVILALVPSLKEGRKERSVEAVANLVRGCKRVYWSLSEDEPQKALWKERIESVGTILLSLLLELKAPNSASSLLSQSPSFPFLTSLAKLHISTGNLSSFSTSLERIDTAADERERKKVVALGKVARGEWSEAEKDWKELVEADRDDLQALNNLAVVLLFSSKLQEAITVLTTLIRERPSLAYSSESLLFNLSTLLELRTDNATREKIGLLRNSVVNGAEGLKGGCFKLTV